MLTKTCPQCGKTYQTYPSVNGKFCGKACADIAKTHAIPYTCAVCGKQCTYYKSRPRTYCSKSCARTALNLTDLNPSYHRDVSGDKNPMFGKGFKGEANPMFGRRGELAPQWKGGRKVRKDGYVLVIAPDNHPYPAYTKNGRKYILEHRLVMERHIGRYLLPKEVVHHIDENPSNNDIDNLRLYANQAEHIRDAH